MLVYKNIPDYSVFNYSLISLTTHQAHSFQEKLDNITSNLQTNPISVSIFSLP